MKHVSLSKIQIDSSSVKYLHYLLIPTYVCHTFNKLASVLVCQYQHAHHMFTANTVMSVQTSSQPAAGVKSTSGDNQ